MSVVYNIEVYHHLPKHSAGVQCVACHMPIQNSMVIGVRRHLQHTTGRDRIYPCLTGRQTPATDATQTKRRNGQTTAVESEERARIEVAVHGRCGIRTKNRRTISMRARGM